jgi:hypothetical protein
MKKLIVIIVLILALSSCEGGLLSSVKAGASWDSGYSYDAKERTVYNAVTYESQYNGNLNHQPDISAIWWQAK